MQQSTVERSGLRNPRGGWGLARRISHNAPFLVLAVAVVAFFAAVNVTFRQTAHAGNAMNQTGGTDGWIALPSQSASAIISAARQSTLFNVNRSGNGDYLKDLSHLGVPQLVSGYMPHAFPGVILSDYYIIPILDTAGNTVGAAVLTLNPQHSAIQVQSIDTYGQPRLRGAIAQMALSPAVALFTAQTHAQLSAQFPPRLVYFNFNFQAAEQGTLTWHGGGIFPDDPVWLLSDINGHAAIVGNDEHLYQPNQLPIVP